MAGREHSDGSDDLADSLHAFSQAMASTEEWRGEGERRFAVVQATVDRVRAAANSLEGEIFAQRRAEAQQERRAAQRQRLSSGGAASGSGAGASGSSGATAERSVSSPPPPTLGEDAMETALLGAEGKVQALRQSFSHSQHAVQELAAAAAPVVAAASEASARLADAAESRNGACSELLQVRALLLLVAMVLLLVVMVLLLVLLW